VGKWTVVGGVGLVAAGAVAGYMGKKLSDDLTAAAAKNQLKASDRSSYDQVDAYATAANVLFVAGGVAVATGAVLWAIAPEPGDPRYPGIHVQGRF
jgi:hypothetical protein